MTDVICRDASPGRRTPATDSVTGLCFLARYVVVGEHEPARCAYCAEECAKVRLAELPGLYGWCSRRFVRPSPPEIVRVDVRVHKPELVSMTSGG